MKTYVTTIVTKPESLFLSWMFWAATLQKNFSSNVSLPQLKLQDSRISHSRPWDPPPPLKDLFYYSQCCLLALQKPPLFFLAPLLKNPLPLKNLFGTSPLFRISLTASQKAKTSLCPHSNFPVFPLQLFSVLSLLSLYDRQPPKKISTMAMEAPPSLFFLILPRKTLTPWFFPLSSLNNQTKAPPPKKISAASSLMEKALPEKHSPSRKTHHPLLITEDAPQDNGLQILMPPVNLPLALQKQHMILHCPLKRRHVVEQGSSTWPKRAAA